LLALEDVDINVEYIVIKGLDKFEALNNDRKYTVYESPQN